MGVASLGTRAQNPKTLSKGQALLNTHTHVNFSASSNRGRRMAEASWLSAQLQAVRPVSREQTVAGWGACRALLWTVCLHTRMHTTHTL